MAGILELEEMGLGEWLDPSQAAAASADSQMKLMAALIATRNHVFRMWWAESDRRKELKLKQAMGELKDTCYALSSLMNAERHR